MNDSRPGSGGLQGVAGGGFGREACEAAAASLEEVGLREKASTAAAALSGGMKRKLQACGPSPCLQHLSSATAPDLQPASLLL